MDHHCYKWNTIVTNSTDAAIGAIVAIGSPLASLAFSCDSDRPIAI
jgi:hypothetical protein